MSAIIDIIGREILDSRGKPTIEADVILESGASGRASVPSGASTGAYEAEELRDNESRFGGMGVRKAVDSINNEIFDVLSGLDSQEQKLIDQTMIDVDGSTNKSVLGANAILGVYLAVAKASAIELGLPLYKYIGGPAACSLPIPMMNILNGGVHADNPIDIQEFMIIPLSAKSFIETIEMGYNVIKSLKENLIKLGLNTNIGDEGGFAPFLSNTNEALDLLLKSINDSNYNPGDDISIALDIASTEFYEDGKYIFKGENISRNREDMIKFYEGIINNYPVISIEDGMAEDDWEGWKDLTSTLGSKTQLVGDDLFVTNIARLKEGVKKEAGNAILIKPNQIGTLSETLDTINFAQKNGFNPIISRRSGETEDETIADIAVATNYEQIKTGSLARSDRTSKYNQLIRIDEELGPLGVLSDFPL